MATQKGITAVHFDEAKRERDPYYWAGFVLHDSWKFPRCKLSSQDTLIARSSDEGWRDILTHHTGIRSKLGG